MIDIDQHLVHLKLLGFTLIEGMIDGVTCFYFKHDTDGKNLIWSTNSLTKLQAIRRMYLILELYEEMESLIEPR
jgi:hypothetical protein